MRLIKLFGFLSLFAIVGCGGGMGPYSSTSAVKSKAPLHINVNTPYFVNDLKQSLYERIRGGEAIPFGEVTQALVKDHYINWVERHKQDKNPSIAEFYTQIQNFASNLPSEELGEIKAEVEKRAAGSVSDLKYNAYAISALDIPYAKKTMCFSGTLLLHLVLREAWGQAKYSAANTVAIYESGHVLPGYVVKKDGVWHLIGIETTVEGTGRVLYGPLAQAMETRMLRVVDGDLLAYVELFKFEADNLVDLTNEAMKLTAEKYGIKDPAYLVAGRFRREADYGKLAWSPLGFGTPDISQGDRNRTKVEESAREALPRANPNATIFHKTTPTPPPTTPAPTPSPTPTDAQFEPAYPYREIKSSATKDKRLFQCWEYRRKIWIDMPHEVGDDGVIYIKYNPCAAGNPKYEPLPAQIKIKVQVRPNPRAGIYGSGGYYGPEDFEDE